jgi:alanine-glyoxylate transaminase/serine-glyoxylate transaminase/serine-pyruvate transaminase
LLVVFEEGLENAYARHLLQHRALVAGLEAMGLAMLVAPEHRLPQLNAVRVPDRVDDAAVRKALLSDHGIEIGGGLGPLKGKVWRIGLMGHTARRENVERFLLALETVLARLGAPIKRDRALPAAGRIWAAASVMTFDHH